MEPYLETVANRNQRCSLTRMRISAHSLGVETLRYRVPKVPYNLRYCRYCTMEEVDSEVHFLGFCETFFFKRQCLIGRLSALNQNFSRMSPNEQIRAMLCPSTPQIAKTTNKYIRIMEKARENIDNGEHISTMTFPPQVFDYVDCVSENESESDSDNDISYHSASSD